MKRFAFGYVLMVLAALALVSLACGSIPGLSTQSTGGDSSGELVGAPTSCDSPATPIGPVQKSSQHIDATTEDYPANCTYYCTEVQSGASSLKVDIANFSADLDMFVGKDAISSVMGADPEDNPWKSNDTDTSSESVTVSSPEAGVYYIEICSYDGSASDFDLSVSAP
jgi:hypothetical protein